MEKTARDIMTTQVVTTTPSATAAQVGTLLAALRISGVPVLSKGEMVGIITEADLLEARWDVPVEQLMTTEVISVDPDASISEVAQILAARGIKRVPVLDRGRELIGIVSRADVVEAMAAGEQDT